jgi:hypothetical protein
VATIVDVAPAILRLLRREQGAAQVCFKDIHDTLFYIFSILVMFFVICRSR